MNQINPSRIDAHNHRQERRTRGHDARAGKHLGNPHRAGDHLNLPFLIVFAWAMISGLLMFTQFHVGHGAFAVSWAGIPKTFWLNIHRIGALCFLVLFVHHLLAHERIVGRRLVKPWQAPAQFMLMLLASITVLAGFTAWIWFSTGMPLHNNARHLCIDIHNISGLLALAGMIEHIRRRWARLWRSQKRSGGNPRTEQAETNQPETGECT